MCMDIYTEDNEYDKVRQCNLKEFSDWGVKKFYTKNSTIGHNEEGSVYLITEGRVKISITSEQGNEKILFIMSPGDIFGEIDSFSINHPYDVIALIDTKINVMSNQEFKSILKNKPEIYENIIKSIIRKYHILYSQLNDLVFKDSLGKLASTLLRMGEQEGESVDGHVEYFYLKQQDIADLLGCSRITITRLLKKLKTEGAIDVGDNKFKILDPNILITYI